MTLIFPDWFQDNTVNVENLFIDIFTKIIPSAPSGVWTADSWLDERDPDPMISWVRLPGGHVNWDAGYDECLIQATVVTGDRDDSNRIMSLIRSCILPMDAFKFKMSDGYTAVIRGVQEVSGPQMLTGEQQVDTRVVPATFKPCVGLRSRARYDQIIKAL
jgi:hypothetical protein